MKNKVIENFKIFKREPTYLLVAALLRKKSCHSINFFVFWAKLYAMRLIIKRKEAVYNLHIFCYFKIREIVRAF